MIDNGNVAIDVAMLVLSALRVRADRHRGSCAGGARRKSRLGGRDDRSPRPPGGLRRAGVTRARRAHRRRGDRRSAGSSKRAARRATTTRSLDPISPTRQRRNVEILRSFAEHQPARVMPSGSFLLLALLAVALLPDGSTATVGAVALARDRLRRRVGRGSAHPAVARACHRQAGRRSRPGSIFRAIGYRGVAPSRRALRQRSPRRDPQRGRGVAGAPPGAGEGDEPGRVERGQATWSGAVATSARVPASSCAASTSSAGSSAGPEG